MANRKREFSVILAPGQQAADDISSESSGPEFAAAQRPHWRPWARGAGALLLGTAVVVGGRSAIERLREPTQGAAASAGTSGRPLFLSQAWGINTCTEWFSEGKDCSTKTTWECVQDDGSQDFNCCCKHGWGDFSYQNNRGPGTINWAENPSKCIDLSMPYVGSGVPFKDGHAMLASCAWGNTNKMWHMPLKGAGRIHWATHPKYCLGVKQGQGFVGNTLGLQRCNSNPSQWSTFDVGYGEPHEPHQIKWQTSPNMCLQVGGGQDGSPIQLANCQANDARQRFNVTQPPQPPPYADTPSLFCVSVMMPRGYEKGLLEDQYSHEVGIFQCNDFAVYSNESITLHAGSKTVNTTVMEGTLKVKFGGQWHSALNTDIFIRFWGKIVEDPRTWENKWTVKIDPDAVYFPSRLHEILRNRWYSGDPKAAVYLNNCHRGMHGPIEVVSQQGLRVYKKRWEECRHGEPYKHKQEDFYFRKCWALLNISKVNVYNLLFENLYACDERSDTRDGRHPCFSRQVSFHPFKSSESYFQCHRRGASMRWVTPMFINDQEPGPQNFHHA